MMAEARISVNFTPTEFDLVRKSLEWVQLNQHRVAVDHDTARGIREDARKEAFLLGEILKKLK
jgi:hypothetical protein